MRLLRLGKGCFKSFGVGRETRLVGGCGPQALELGGGELELLL